MMARAPRTFKESDAARLVRAVRKAGCEVFLVDADKDGKITVVTGKPESGEPPTDLDSWMEKHHAR